ncbi:unnamed protein product [Owenia fusiformis]|uniref:Uncharacterized protein n=1 Tax=Owenia fusiformis TaxID=6347 RepID=A0A8J1XSB6_OWEFU|nr:unnamed protein product [Owenia fusiformis]
MGATILQLLVVTLIGLCLAQPTPPGLRARMTTKGMDYVSSVAVKILRDKVRGMHINDASGEADIKVGKVKYSFTGMKLDGFSGLDTKVHPIAGRGLEWTANIGNININGDWRYEVRVIFKIKDHGTFTASVSEVRFKMGVSLDHDPQGHLTIKSTSCNAYVGGARVRFSGGASWLYNLFSHNVEKTLKKELTDIICREARRAVDKKAEDFLSHIPLSVRLGDHNEMMLDYGLTAAPNFAADHMETYHKGEVHWATGGKRSSASRPAPFPDSTESTSMLYVWASDYVLRTLADTAQTHGILQQKVNPKDFPLEQRGAFNTTCHVGLCIGGVIPELGKKFPNTTVSLGLASKATPNVTITPDGVHLRFQGNIDFSANLPNGVEKHAFSANTSLFLVANASVNTQTNKVTSQIVHQRVKIGVLESAIGNISDAGLQFAVSTILRIFVIPKLNELGGKGMPVPNFGPVKLLNPQLHLLQNAIMVKTDARYVPKDTTLYY